MASDSFAEIWNRVDAFCPAAGPVRSQRWVIDAFRRIAERKRWSWLVKYNQFIIPTVYNTGTVAVTQNSTTVIGSGTAWTGDLVGRQFRIGVSAPIYTISQVNSATSLDLELPYGGQTNASVGYQIYLCYVTPPSDFLSFISVWDPNYSWQLMLNTSQEELNSWDAQRANMGQAYLLANLDYARSSIGSVDNPIEIIGAGPAPSISGTAFYNGPANAIFTVQVTTGGVSTTAVYKWKKNGGAFNTGITTDTGPQDLSDGVSIYWPDTVVYVVGDTFVIRTNISNVAGTPRFELWPHNLGNYVYPFLYEQRAPDINEPGFVLPRIIRGDVIMDMALAMAAKWPGPSVDEPNPYFDMNLSDRLEKRNEQMIGELERQDEEIFQTMASYATNLSYAPYFDARFVQSHGFMY